tara:strand:+ start:294 stop:1070 length:777 start_codon:yes stop_codon:yes gene_type:complete
MFKIVKLNSSSVKDLPSSQISLDFALAEFSSAIEMLQAAKRVDDKKLALGFLNHSLDEYRHTNFFIGVLKHSINSNTKENYLKFNSILAYSKGFLREDGYLFDKMNLQSFSVFIGVNEQQALKIFQKLKNSNWNLGNKLKQDLNEIIDDEKKHLELAHKNFETDFVKLLKDESRHASLALDFSKKNFPAKIYYPLYFRFFLFNKIRHLIGNNNTVKKIISYVVSFLIIVLSFSFRYSLSTKNIKNNFDLNKKNANLIL